MTLPSFSAEQSLYPSSRHYRASALAGAVGAIRPSDALPPGSHQNSCDLTNCSYDGDILSCLCTDLCRNQIYSELAPVSNCKKNINNCNGLLNCGSC